MFLIYQFTLAFSVKDEGNGVVRDVRDATGIST